MGKRIPPEEERARLLSEVHTIHQGADGMFRQLLTEHQVIWPGMRKHCRALVARCPSCLLFDVPRTGYLPLKSSSARTPFEVLSIDLAGPFVSTERGQNYVLVTVDDFTGFVVIRPLVDKSAAVVAQALWSIMCDFGAPQFLRSDRGLEFTNRVIAALSEKLGVEHRVTAAYHPQANGKAEALVKLTKSAIFKLTYRYPDQWDLTLPLVQAGLNRRIPRRTLSAPFTLLFGRSFQADSHPVAPVDDSNEEAVADWVESLKLLFEHVHPAVAVRVQSQDASSTSRHDSRSLIQAPFQAESLVMKRIPGLLPKSVPKWHGPFIVSRFSQKSGTYVLRQPSGETLPQKVPHSQLKLIDLPPLSPPSPDSPVAFSASTNNTLFDALTAPPPRPTSRQNRAGQKRRVTTPLSVPVLSANPVLQPRPSISIPDLVRTFQRQRGDRSKLLSTEEQHRLLRSDQPLAQANPFQSGTPHANAMTPLATTLGMPTQSKSAEPSSHSVPLSTLHDLDSRVAKHPTGIQSPVRTSSRHRVPVNYVALNRGEPE